MTKITILLHHDACSCITSCHCRTHIDAFIEDEATARSIHINFGNTGIRTDHDLNLRSLQLERANEQFFSDAITLHSQMDYDQFVMNYYHDFGNSERYGFVFNNCADAVDYALDYFFPEKTAIELFFCTYQTLCCWLCVGSCGLASYLPMIPLISSPQ